MEKTIIKATVYKIITRKPVVGPTIYEFYVSVDSIKKFGKIKKSKIVGPLFIVTEKHMIPTSSGYKFAEKVSKGDAINLSLDLLVI